MVQNLADRDLWNISGQLSIDVKNCQRCGEDHSGLQFRPLRNPADEYNWFGICRNSRQPILMAIKDKDD